MAEAKSFNPDRVEDNVEVIDYDSDKEDQFEDASDSINEGDGPNDLTRPSEWRPSGETDNDTGPEVGAGDEVVKDSLGHEESSPDYVDETLLKSWEHGDNILSDTELEQKRLEAAQYKIEGNALYTDSKTREACGKMMGLSFDSSPNFIFVFSDKYTAGLRVCPLKFSQDRAVLYANRGQMKRVMGLSDLAIKNCSKAIELNPSYLKALLRRAEIYEETEKLGDLFSSFQLVNIGMFTCSFHINCL